MRYRLRTLVLLAGVLFAWAELYRRDRRTPRVPPLPTWFNSGRPLPPPWLPASPCTTAGARVWINMDDVQAGVKAPRTKWV
jgi:hypothetical protein